MLTAMGVILLHMDSIADRLRYVIKNAPGVENDSVQQFADLIGVTRSAVYQWLDGTTEPSPTALFTIEDKTGFRPRWVVLNEPPMRLKIPAKRAAEIIEAMSEQLDQAS